MRLRNIPRANDVIASSPLVIQDPKAQRGQWKEVFGNDHQNFVGVAILLVDISKKGGFHSKGQIGRAHV